MKISNNSINLKRLDAKKNFMGPHHYAILTENGRTNRQGVLIEEGALTEGVRYLVTFYQVSELLLHKAMPFQILMFFQPANLLTSYLLIFTLKKSSKFAGYLYDTIENTQFTISFQADTTSIKCTISYWPNSQIISNVFSVFSILALSPGHGRGTVEDTRSNKASTTENV